MFIVDVEKKEGLEEELEDKHRKEMEKQFEKEVKELEDKHQKQMEERLEEDVKELEVKHQKQMKERLEEEMKELEDKHRKQMEERLEEDVKSKHQKQVTELKIRQTKERQTNIKECSSYLDGLKLPLNSRIREIDNNYRNNSTNRSYKVARQLYQDLECVQSVRARELMSLMLANQAEKESMEIEYLFKQQILELDLLQVCELADFKAMFLDQSECPK